LEKRIPKHEHRISRPMVSLPELKSRKRSEQWKVIMEERRESSGSILSSPDGPPLRPVQVISVP
ncbi:hypothetical protein K0M31_006169, partial [Melipona bicolor]